MTLAAAVGSDGIVSVQGTGSALSLTGDLTVGGGSAGELSVLGGAMITAANLLIGTGGAGSTGNVDIEGAGSHLILTGGTLNIGAAGGGSGSLTIGAGTTLTYSGIIVESGLASFNNNGGVIDPDGIEFTTATNAGNGLNEYNLFVGNINAVQVASGTGTWLAPMIITGTSVADAANNIDVNSDVGQWQISQSGTLVINANTIDAGQAIVFEDATGTLVIGQVVNGGAAGTAGVIPTIGVGAANLLQAGGFSAGIWGYRAGDKILFNNLSVLSDSIVGGNTIDLVGAGGTLLGALTFFSKTGAPLIATSANILAAAAQLVIPCFLAGTAILTPSGEVAVENLVAGDLVQTWSGQSRRIVWAGMGRTLVTPRNRCDVTPVIVRAGALADGVPSRDLHVTRHHALLVGDVLIPAEHLVNDASIVWDDRARVVEYYHLELDSHDILVADGAPAESFRDDDSANLFQNRASRGSRAPMPPCRKVVESGALLDAAWAHVAARVPGRKTGGWTEDSDLHLIVDERRIEGVRSRDGTWSFDLPLGFGSIAIGSRSTIPATMGGADLRRVGVAVREMTFWRYNLGRNVKLDHTDIGDGWYDMARGHRWTKGLACVPINEADWRVAPNRLEIVLVDVDLRYRRPLRSA